MTQANVTWKQHVFPEDWTQPTASGTYDLVVLGGGPAGLVTASAAAGLGARVALVEATHLGGDCLNVGCVPSKTLLASAHAAGRARQAGRVGVSCEVSVDGAAVMARVRQVRADIAPHDSARRFTDMGIDVFLGRGVFVAPNAMDVAGQRLTFRRAVIATGARSARPPIPGLDLPCVVDNTRIFEEETVPKRLVVLGGGVIGCELGQAFARLGSAVTILEGAPRILPRADREAAEVLAGAMREDGVTLSTSSTIRSVEQNGPTTEVVYTIEGAEYRVAADTVLLALGRTPNTEGLNCEVAGVARTSSGHIQVNDNLRTSNPRIFAAGDVVGKQQFTHAADAMARAIVRNALFLGRERWNDRVVPWSTYTQPEVAHVGLSIVDAEKDSTLTLIRVPLGDLDRVKAEGGEAGFVKVFADRSGRIVSASVAGEQAGELINTIAFIMQQGIRVSALAEGVWTYPTRSEALRRVGDAWNRDRLTPFVAGALKRVIRWQR